MMVKRNVDPRPRFTKVIQESHLPGIKDLTLLENGMEVLPVAQFPKEPAMPGGFADHVYAHAAAIFQNVRVEKPATRRLVSYCKKTDQPLPEAKDAVSKRWAYELTFNALKYQDLLENIMVDSGVYLSHPLPEDLMSLAVVMLYDFLDRKFLPRERPDGQEEERLGDVREAESYLLRFKTKLAASLARCRIKHDLLSIDCILPVCVREKKERACTLPLYAWVNTLKTSLGDVCSVLRREGFSEVNSIRQLEGLTFCQDLHGHDLLVFPPHLKADLHRTRLLSEHKLVIQDKSCCLAPSAVRPLLAQDSDVLMTGSFSVLTIAHMAALADPCSGHVLVSGESWSPDQREVLANMGCKNVTLVQESFLQMDEWDPQVQGVRLILLMPPCSASSVSNPVEFILSENGNADLLQDLAKGSITPAKLEALVASQTRDLTHALKFSKVRAVVYCTSSIYREENEEVVGKVLEQGVESPKQQLFRLTAPGLPPCSMPKEGNAKDEFFKMDPSEDNNGCFMAVLTREVPGETVQDILARAAATGLLDGIGPKQPPKKEKRRRMRHAANTHPPAHPPARLRASIGRLQSRIDPFLTQEVEGDTSQPAVALQASGGGDSPTKGPGKSKGRAHRRSLPKSITPNARTSLTQNNVSTVTNTARRLGQQLSSKRAPGTAKTSWAGPSMPPAPPTSRQEALRPMEMILPPVAFPSLSSISSGKSTLPPPYQSPAPSSHSLRAGSKTSLCLSSSSSLSRDRASAVWHPRPWH